MTSDMWLLLFVGSGFGFVPLVVFGTIILFVLDKIEGKGRKTWVWWNA